MPFVLAARDLTNGRREGGEQVEQRGVSRGITAGPTFRGAVALWAATAVNLGSTLLFHSLIARPNGAGTYAAAASLLWFGALASTLSSGVQYALARISATTNATSGDLFRRGLWVAGPWMAVSVLALVFSPEIASYLHLASAWPVAGAAWLWAVTVLYAIPTGIMVGRRKLGLFALLMLAGAGLRFVFMVPFGWSSRYGGAAVVSSALTLTTLVA